VRSFTVKVRISINRLGLASDLIMSWTEIDTIKRRRLNPGSELPFIPHVWLIRIGVKRTSTDSHNIGRVPISEGTSRQRHPIFVMAADD